VFSLDRLAIVAAIVVYATSAFANPAYDPAPFDLGVEKLLPEYNGADAEMLFSALAAIKDKGEFETTEQYKARIAAKDARPVIDSLYANSLLAFRFLVEETHYDADAQLLDAVAIRSNDDSLTTLELATAKSADGFIRVLPWRRDTIDLGTHDASNTLGETVEISKSMEFELDVELCREALNCVDLPKDAFKVSMPPDAAEKAKSKIALLCIGHLQADPSQRALHLTGHSEPKIDRRSDFYSDSYTDASIIGFRPVALWLFNIETGDVLKKIPIAAGDRSTTGPASGDD
jgi:hypothetical protein